MTLFENTLLKVAYSCQRVSLWFGSLPGALTQGSFSCSYLNVWKILLVAEDRLRIEPRVKN